MDELYEGVDAHHRTSMAIRAGCDMVIVCQNLRAQLDVLEGLRSSIITEDISIEQVKTSIRRITDLKDRYTNWQRALSPAGVAALQDLKADHERLAARAYRSAISVVRDHSNALSFWRTLAGGCPPVLLLTPLIDLFHSTATRIVSFHETEFNTHRKELSAGEEVFQEFGAHLAKRSRVLVLHASYSSNGIRPHHEEMIARAAAAIVITADATRNAYQYGVVKLVNMLC